jgi:hypothetical protein
MIRYQYAPLDPPAPMINVTVANPVLGGTVGPTAALLDTGADQTLIPGWVVRALELVEERRISVRGYDDGLSTLPVSVVRLRVHDFAELLVEVIHGDGSDYVVLGRDVLNRYVVKLDGPDHAFEIS